MAAFHLLKCLSLDKPGKMFIVPDLPENQCRWHEIVRDVNKKIQ